jgi:prepilin-type N-terminal cleavage/methylation domain-containing protein
MNRQHKGQMGFTLLEVMVTILISSILAVLLMQVMRGHITRSIWPLEKIDEALALHAIMDQITADYRNLLMTDQQPLVTLQDRINAEGYWSEPLQVSIVDNYCLDLDKSGEVRTNDNCVHPVDTLLKVTIEYGPQSLTSLFSR